MEPHLRVSCMHLPKVDWRPVGTVLKELPVVWQFNIHVVARLINEYQPWLSEQEWQRAARFRNAADHIRFLTGRCGLRFLLHTQYGVALQHIKIGTSPKQKPFLASNDQLFFFNISHSGDLVLLAFDSRDIGVDVEQGKPLYDMAGVMDISMHPEEKMVIAKEDQPQHAFYRHWVRKEALLKGLGLGITDSLGAWDVREGTHLYTRTPDHQGYVELKVYSFPAGDGYVGAVSLVAPSALPAFAMAI